MNTLVDADLTAANEALDTMINVVKSGKTTAADDILQELMLHPAEQRTLAILLTVALQRLAR